MTRGSTDVGCNCGGGGASQRTIASRTQAAAFVAAGSPLGFNRDNPITIGESSDGEIWRVRVISPVEGLSIGQAVFVTGTGVTAHLDSGALHDITTTDQKKRLFKVGAFTYTSEQEANRVAAALGTKPVEVA